MRRPLPTLMLVVALAASAVHAAPVARWTFDDPANLGKDATGNGFDLEVQGSVTPTAGKKGGAIRLAKGKNYLRIAHKPRLNSPEFAISAWVKTPAPTKDYQAIAASRGGDGGFLFYATKNGAYGFFLAYQGADRGRMSGPSQRGTIKQRAIAPGKWVRLVGTFKPEATQPDALGNYKGMATFYIDGKAMERRNMDYKPTKTAYFTIGAFNGGKNDFEGEIDEVAFWNSADPIAAHEGMEVDDPYLSMSPEEREWTSSLRVSDRAMKTRDYYREAYAFVPDRPDKPNVLLIGDSISEGYTRIVRRILKDKADVYRIPQNGGHVLRGVENIVDSKNWLLGKKDWAVIHFNWGLHDLVRLKKDENGKTQYDVTGAPRHTHALYEENLDKIVKALKATGATVICGLTTPVPPNSRGRVNGDEIAFNEVARKVAEENGIAVNDLHSLIVPVHDEVMQSPGNVHFNDKGREMNGKQVAETIEKALGAR